MPFSKALSLFPNDGETVCPLGTEHLYKLHPVHVHLHALLAWQDELWIISSLDAHRSVLQADSSLVFSPLYFSIFLLFSFSLFIWWMAALAQSPVTWNNCMTQNPEAERERERMNTQTEMHVFITYYLLQLKFESQHEPDWNSEFVYSMVCNL